MSITLTLLDAELDPSPERLAEVQKLYLTELEQEITEAEAREVLTSIMQFIYLTYGPCTTTPSTPENLTTTPR